MCVFGDVENEMNMKNDKLKTVKIQVSHDNCRHFHLNSVA